jgi:nucleotide-binding universal stress UspA family protein
MNRIVLGIDTAGHYEAALRLLARLRPEGAAVDVFHAAEIPVLYGDMMLPAPVELMADAMAEERKTGGRLCEEVAQRLRDRGITARAPEIIGGPPALEIMEYADRVEARLIAVGGTKKGPIGAFLTGSVVRALVIGAHQSVLIGKGDLAPEGPIRAVFATDHSSYADRCIPELLALAPRGISHLTVMTCYPKEFVRAIRPFLPEFVLDPSEWIEKNLHDRNEKVVSELAPLGCEISTRVFCDTATSSIPRAMKETGADLLILGAQGHGFVERLSLGSTSFHQTMAEPYPVLVLRVPKTERREAAASAQRLAAPS